VAAVNHLKECNLRVAGQVNILGTVSDKLHKSSTSHFCLYHTFTK
jgi:hypothetical protein